MSGKRYYRNYKGFDKGKDFGFITKSDGEDLFFHISQLVDGVNSIKPGQTVSFNVAKGKKGNIAVNIK